MTWYLSEGDLPDINDYDIINNPRTYMYFRGPVQFPFGHGLGYATFKYDNIEAVKNEDGCRVSCSVRNTGALAGDEVAQLYAVLRGVPVKAPLQKLCGFERISLAPGDTRVVSFDVPNNELTLFDENTGAFSIRPESVTFNIGASSADIRLSTDI